MCLFVEKQFLQLPENGWLLLSPPKAKSMIAFLLLLSFAHGFNGILSSWMLMVADNVVVVSFCHSV